MHLNDEDSESRLEPELMAHLDNNPRLPASLEDSLVETLQQSGALRSMAVASKFPSTRSSHERTPRTRSVAFGLAAAAAMLVAFLAGTEFGAVQERQSYFGLLTGDARDNGIPPGNSASQQLGRAALAYLEALAAVDQADSIAGKVALLSVRAAGDQIMRIAPHSEEARAMQMVAFGVLRIDPSDATALAPQTRLLWF